MKNIWDKIFSDEKFCSDLNPREFVKDNIRLCIPLQVNYNTHTLSVGLIANVRNAGNVPVLHRLGDLDNDLGFDGLDIWPRWGQCRHMDDIKNRLGAKGLAKLMAKNKLEVAAFSIYLNNFSRYSELIGDYGGGVVVRGTKEKKLTDPK